MGGATFEADLRGILQVARGAFRHHVLYSDPDENDYLARSRRLRELVPLELSWLAEHGERDGRVCVCPSGYMRARSDAPGSIP